MIAPIEAAEHIIKPAKLGSLVTTQLNLAEGDKIHVESEHGDIALTVDGTEVRKHTTLDHRLSSPSTFSRAKP